MAIRDRIGIIKKITPITTKDIQGKYTKYEVGILLENQETAEKEFWVNISEWKKEKTEELILSNITKQPLKVGDVIKVYEKTTDEAEKYWAVSQIVDLNQLNQPDVVEEKIGQTATKPVNNAEFDTPTINADKGIAQKALTAYKNGIDDRTESIIKQVCLKVAGNILSNSKELPTPKVVMEYANRLFEEFKKC